MIGSMDCKRLGIVMLLVLMVSSTSIYAGRNDGDGAFGNVAGNILSIIRSMATRHGSMECSGSWPDMASGNL